MLGTVLYTITFEVDAVTIVAGVVLGAIIILLGICGIIQFLSDKKVRRNLRRHPRF